METQQLQQQFMHAALRFVYYCAFEEWRALKSGSVNSQDN
jgi:hypothetical protein